MIKDEKTLYGPITEYFLNQGYFVISGAEKSKIKGTSEFGVWLPNGNSVKKYRTVDILAFKWNQNTGIYSIAVECKLYDTSREGVGAALHQATDYQLYFDEVYTATQPGELQDKQSVLESLGLGHISIDARLNEITVVIPAEVRVTERFNSSLNTIQVLSRLALPLTFQDIFNLPIRYMHTHRGGLWVAKDVVPGSKIQHTAGGGDNGQRMYFAINIEFIEDLRKIVNRVDRDKLSSCFKSLGNECTVTLGIDELRTDHRMFEPIKGPANSISVNNLLEIVKTETSLPEGARRKTKPHLSIRRPLYRWDEQLTRLEYRARLEDSIAKFAPLTQVFRECF